MQSFTNQLDTANQEIKQIQNNKIDNKNDISDSLLIMSTDSIEELELEMQSNISLDCMPNLDVEMLFSSCDA